MTLSQRIRNAAESAKACVSPDFMDQVCGETAYDELMRVANELEGAIIVKPYSMELAHGKVKYLRVRGASASAETWEEAAMRLQQWYDEESDKASGGVYYVRAGMTQGKPMKEE